MARPKKTKTTLPEKPAVHRGAYWLPNDATWGGFINMRLDDEQRGDFNVWFSENSVEISRLLDDAVGDGVKFGLAYDDEHECYISTFTGALVGGSNERYTCTSRAATMVEAIGLAAWKHFVLTQGDYGNFKPANATFMSWG